MEDRNLAYIAGFFDGEGCITTTNQYILIAVTNTVRAPLELIESIFRGNIREYQPKNAKHKKVYVWETSGKNAGIVLESLLPYLIVKKERAILGIEFTITSSMHKKAEIYVELRALNH